MTISDFFKRRRNDKSTLEPPKNLIYYGAPTIATGMSGHTKPLDLLSEEERRNFEAFQARECGNLKEDDPLNFSTIRTKMQDSEGPHNIAQVSTKAMVYGLPGERNISMEEYAQGAKNLEKLEKLYGSPLEEAYRKQEVKKILLNIEEMDKEINEIKDEIEKERTAELNNRLKSLEDTLDQLLLRIENLESILSDIRPSLSIPHATIKNTSKGINNIYMDIKIYNTTNAILDVLKENQKELHLKDIFSRIKKYNLKNPNVTYNTFKSTIYSLVKKKKVKAALHYGCFQIRRSFKDN